MENKEYYEKMQKTSYDHSVYSSKRIDVLIIILSGGGIYTCLEVFKYLIDNNFSINFVIIISSIFFVISIISNLISQFCAEKSNFFDSKMYDTYVQKFDTHKDEKLLDSDIDDYDKKSTTFNNWTIYLNYTSLLTLILALVCVVISFFIIFSEV